MNITEAMSDERPADSIEDEALVNECFEYVLDQERDGRRIRDVVEQCGKPALNYRYKLWILTSPGATHRPEIPERFRHGVLADAR